MNLGIDLGTSRVVICSENEGVVLDEPSVIAVQRDTGRVITCGEEAEVMLGRTPPSIIATRPIQNGVIAQYELAEQMLRYFLHRVCSNRVTKPCAAVSIAEGLTEVERRSFIETVISAGARRVTLVPETVASAIGAGMDVSLPLGQMIVNIGGGTSVASVLSLKGVAVSRSIRVAGMAMDEAIVRYLRSEYGLLISDSAAQRIKCTVGCAVLPENPLSVIAKGRDIVTGLPRKQTVDSGEINGALAEPLELIASLVQRVLEVTPPELAGDLMHSGIWLAGGAAQLTGLPQLIQMTTGIACHVAEQPGQCAAIGACRALQYSSSFSEVYDLGDFSYHLSDTITN